MRHTLLSFFVLYGYCKSFGQHPIDTSYGVRLGGIQPVTCHDDVWLASGMDDFAEKIESLRIRYHIPGL